MFPISRFSSPGATPPAMPGMPQPPLPFLFRFPPPFGLMGQLPGGMPPFPAALSAFLEARVKQLDAMSGPSSVPMNQNAIDVPKSGLKRKYIHRPTKQIHVQLLDGAKIDQTISVNLRHTENAEALEKLTERCDLLTLITISAADSMSHTVIYTGKTPLDEADNVQLPTCWRQVCHQTSSPTEANITDDGSILRPINFGDEVVFLSCLPRPEAFDRSNAASVTASDARDSVSPSAASAATPGVTESVNSHPLSVESLLSNSNVTAATPNRSIPSGIDMPGPGGFQCERCGKMFSYAYYRDKHLKYTRCVDNGDRKFPCPLCTRSFEKRDRLRIHILHVHENHRPHVCTVCGKSFSQSSSLNKHLRVHSGERPYKCPFCSKSFTASSILRTHIRQHSGEKPFKCTFCGKSFASHAAHDSHVRRTHSDHNTSNLVKCQSCDKCFDNESHLKFHVQCFHNANE